MTTGVVVLVVVLVAATALGFFVSRYNGHFRGAVGKPDAAAGDASDVVDENDLPEPFGEMATLLQFSSAFCAPCRATRRVLGEVADIVPGVRHVEVDAEDNLGLVRRLGVMRTPTTFVLDAEGAIVTRASGQPRKADVIAALGRVKQ